MTDGWTLDHGHPISSPCEPNGSGELTNYRTFRKNPDLLQEDVEFLFLKWAHYSKNFNQFYCSFPAVSHMMYAYVYLYTFCQHSSFLKAAYYCAVNIHCKQLTNDFRAYILLF